MFTSLRSRLLLLVLLAVIPALVLILYNATSQRQVAAANAQANAQWVAQQYAADQERLIAETRQLLLTLAHLPEVQGSDPVACSVLLSKLLKQYPQYGNLGVISPEGAVTCSALDSAKPIDLSGRAYFQRALNDHTFSVSNYQLDDISGKQTINFAYPVIDESLQVQSIVFAALDLSWLNEQISTSQMPEGAALIVVDQNKDILVHYPEPERWIGQSLPTGSDLQTILDTQAGPRVLRGVDGIRRLYVFTPLQDITETGFYIGVGISEEIAFAQANQILTRYLVGFGFVFVLALAAAWLGGDIFILSQVRSLLRATNRLAGGDLNVRTGIPHGQGELGQLAQSFDQMTEALQLREAERRRVEDEIIRHNRALAALNTITATVSSSLELPEILESLKILLLEELNVPGGILLFYDESCDMLYVETAWGLPAASLSELKRFPASRYHYEQVVRENRPFLALDYRAIEPFSSLDLEKTRPSWQSYLSIPLAAKGRVQGVLDLFSKAPDEFREDSVTLFTALGQQVGVAIQNARLFEQARTSREQLQLLSQRLLEVQESERRHIARELHDEIGQALTAVKVNLQSVKRLSGETISTAPLDDSISLVERTLQQVRDLSLDLRPSLLDDLGVVSALRWYIDRQAQRAGFKSAFIAELPEERLPAELETTCFRVVQEALTNIVRHARAKQVWIELREIENRIELLIRDDGIGFDVSAVLEQASGDLSLGVLGMQERVQLIGGQITIHSDPNRGTEIHVYFPLAPGQAITRPLLRRRVEP